ncbi:TIGR00269 family protein [Candidatus Woesearchaeota archaeon CG10_big_fil_rev_8_21_14_0_10_34_8]|nr:MAG: TIGR00269 family protein [Candidatus Woesearchaeota archaeon CG10_big_fil_rev_8_21_14_0_10_34_8]
MKCKTCKQKAVFIKPTLCKIHFLKYVEDKVNSTIKKYKLIAKKDKIVVGVSGGKDSLTILYLLRKHNPIALCIDEGIAGYRNSTIKDMKSFCKKHKLEYKIISFKEEFGLSLDKMLAKLKIKPCTICGTYRRYLLNKKARELKATKLVTGHNMDDESQAVLMNLMKHQVDIMPRLGLLTGVVKDKRFIPRIKPLYFLTEKEIAAYSLLQDFGIKYTTCPYAVQAYRSEVGDFLNELEKDNHGSKLRLLTAFVKQLPKLKKTFKPDPINSCIYCQEPCMQNVCKACQYLQKLEASS